MCFLVPWSATGPVSCLPPRAIPRHSGNPWGRPSENFSGNPEELQTWGACSLLLCLQASVVIPRRAAPSAQQVEARQLLTACSAQDNPHRILPS